MFATFELYRGGWVDAGPKRKRVRSWSGCLPCRKRKKKCDETRPVCQRCAKLNSLECHFPSSDETFAPPKWPENAANQVNPRSGNLVQFPKPRDATLSPILTPGTMVLESPYNHILSSFSPSITELTDNIPSCSMPDLFLVFHPAAHGLDLGPQSSIISLTMPMINQSAAVFHAMVSCSSIFLCQKLPTWKDIALYHHGKTLRNLALEMRQRNLDDPEVAVSIMAVVMMLHLFQKFDTLSQTPSNVHLLAAQEVLYTAFSRPLPDSILGNLILEACAYRIAINSLFHPDLLKAYTFLETTTTLITPPASQNHRVESLRCALWLGLPVELYDTIYKISFLKQKMPLKGADWFEAVAIDHRLKALYLSKPSNAAMRGQQSRVDIDAAICYVRRLYILAAKLLLLRVMEPNIRAVDAHIQYILRSALDDMASYNSNAPILMFPIVVLGTAAVDERDRELILCQLDRMRFLSGDREVNDVLRFLQTSWGNPGEAVTPATAGSKGGPIQLDVWLEDTYLRSVTI